MSIEHPVNPGMAIGSRFTRWFDHAACRGEAVEEFFEHSVIGGRPSPHAYAAAQRFCAQCLVLSSCRREAARNDDVGLWGGQWRSTERHRRPVDLLPPQRPDR